MTTTERQAAEAQAAIDALAAPIIAAHAVSLDVARELVRLSAHTGIAPTVLLELRYDEHAGTVADRAALARARSEGDVGPLFKAPSLGTARIVRGT